LKNVYTGKYLNVYGGKAGNGVNIQQYYDDKTASMSFAFNSTSIKTNPTPTPTSTPSGFLYPLKGSITRSSSVKTNGYYCDYKASAGTPIYAPANGTVYFKQSYAVNYSKLASYGNNIYFESSDGVYTVRCAHLSSFNNVSLKYTASLAYPCSAGKYTCKTITLAQRTVSKGDLLGYTGSTGNASGPHVHIEVTKNGSATDPSSVFTTWN
jgi:murein DD-endopeptidase MepM/ murein hydrolase activator NlpD